MPRFLLCKYSAHSFRAGVFPSSQRRGGRDIKRYREASFEERTGWSLTSHISECVLNMACERPPRLRPLRRLRDIFLVAQPPLLWEGSIPPEQIWLRRSRAKVTQLNRC